MEEKIRKNPLVSGEDFWQGDVYLFRSSADFSFLLHFYQCVLDFGIRLDTILHFLELSLKFWIFPDFSHDPPLSPIHEIIPSLDAEKSCPCTSSAEEKPDARRDYGPYSEYPCECRGLFVCLETEIGDHKHGKENQQDGRTDIPSETFRQPIIDVDDSYKGDEAPNDRYDKSSQEDDQYPPERLPGYDHERVYLRDRDP